MTLDLDTRPAPVEVVTPITPSVLLRLGRMLVPARAVNALVRYRRGEAVAACAMGAMAVAAGAASDLDDGGFWWPGGFDSAPRVFSPCACNPGRLNHLFMVHDRLPGPRIWARPRAYRAPVIVAHLSDEHGGRGGHSRLGDHWPTARIASWLEGLGL